jgi:hypothetical protein
MTLQQTEHLMLIGGLTLLISFMFFIIWDLTRKANAGKLATFALFFVLGLAPAVFVLKELTVFLIEVLG